MNYKYTWNNFYIFVLKITDVLKEANSNKKSIFKLEQWTKTVSVDFW
jgi:hypothetical protein